MDKQQPITGLILRYAGVMTALCVITQIVIALRGSRMDWVATIALLPAFVYYLYFHLAHRTVLGNLRFGRLVAHGIGFLIVNLSYHIHAAFLIISETAGKGPEVHLTAGWFGVLFGMFIFWGLGLGIHTVASVANKGYEGLDA